MPRKPETTPHINQTLLDKMARRGVSPEDVIFDIIAGKDSETHPLIYALLEVASRQGGAPPTARQWAGLCKLAEKHEGDFTRPIPIELRGALAKDLMPYMYPKLSSNQHQAKIESSIKVAGLSLTVNLSGAVPTYPDAVPDPLGVV